MMSRRFKAAPKSIPISKRPTGRMMALLKGRQVSFVETDCIAGILHPATMQHITLYGTPSFKAASNVFFGEWGHQRFPVARRRLGDVHT
jgi:hypothetical protein